REMRAAVRVVLEPLDTAGDAVLVAPEVDEPIVPPVTAAAVPGRDPPLIVAAAGLRQRHEKRLVRWPLVQRIVDDAHRETLSGGRGFELLHSHFVPSACLFRTDEVEIVTGGKAYVRLLPIRPSAPARAEALRLARHARNRHAVDLDLEQ